MPKGTKTLYLPSSVQTGGFAVPKRVESEIASENRQMVEELEHVAGNLAYYNRELEKLFPGEHLQIVMAKPKTTVVGLKPGYYHIVRMRPGTMAYIKPIEGPNGEWRDLDSSVFEMAAEDDLWNDRTQKELRRMHKKAEEARQRQIMRERQERAAEFDSRLWHATHVSVSIPRSLK